MSRRSFVAALGLCALLAAVVAGSVLLMVRYEPKDYVLAPLPRGEQCKECSTAFWTEVSHLSTTALNDREWDASFTDAQINSFLNDGLAQSGLARLPDGVSDPRVVFEDDRIRLAFRFRRGLICTVISMDLKVWLARDEPNVVAVQLEDFRAGVLPIASHWLIELISAAGQQNGVDVNWYRHDGYPVALIRLQPDQSRPAYTMQSFKTAKGLLTIQGRSNDANGHPDLRLSEGLLKVNGS